MSSSAGVSLTAGTSGSPNAGPRRDGVQSAIEGSHVIVVDLAVLVEVCVACVAVPVGVRVAAICWRDHATEEWLDRTRYWEILALNPSIDPDHLWVGSRLVMP